jgi:enoyl-[acyl-carrier protein] reductase II
MSQVLLSTRVTELLGIRYPIIQGAMAWVTASEMAAAVCNAGALGTLAAATWGPERLREEIRLLREKTSGPFAVNIPLRLPTARGAMEVVLEEAVPIVVLSAGDPMPWVRPLLEAKSTVLQVVFNCEMASRAKEAGVHALIAMGAEAGGNLCPDELSTMVLVPQVADITGLPVIAAGGIADGRGLAAALALGADGIQMGTRLLATRECTVHPRYKQAVLDAGDTATTVIGRSTGLEFRALKNELTRRIRAMERWGEKKETIDARTFEALKLAVTDGDVERGAVLMGQAAGMIREEESVSRLLDRITNEAVERLAALAHLAGRKGGEQ